MVTHHTEHTFNTTLSHIAPHIPYPTYLIGPMVALQAPLNGAYLSMRSITMSSGGALGESPSCNSKGDI